MGLEEEIKNIASQKLTDRAQFIVEVVVSARKGPKKLLVVVDGDQGVSIDDCATLSRELSKELDESTLVDESYTLEVSTPGLDQPLKLKRQYVKNIGRRLKVKMADKIEEGKLDTVNDEGITLISETGTGKKK